MALRTVDVAALTALEAMMEHQALAAGPGKLPRMMTHPSL